MIPWILVDRILYDRLTFLVDHLGFRIAGVVFTYFLQNTVKSPLVAVIEKVANPITDLEI